MTIVLGIHPGHNASAALVIDGKIVSAVDEERFNRKKNWGGGYPEKSVKYVLEQSKISIDDVDAISIPVKDFTKIEIIKLGLRYLRYPSLLKNRFKKNKENKIGYKYYSKVVLKGLANQFKEHAKRLPKIIGVDHHMAHAASAFYPSGFSSDCVVITSDGVGGAISSSVSLVKKGKLRRISSSLEPGSIGHFYEALTDGLDFLVNNDEYKVMGMASYGDWRIGGYKELLSLAPKVKGLNFSRKPWRIHSTYSDNFWYVNLEESSFIKILARKYGKINVAAAGQRVFEDVILKWIKNIIKKTGVRKICAAGGSFLNIKANKRIRDELGIDLFVFPHAGDGGLSVGSALFVTNELNPTIKFERIESLALGPGFDEDEIERELKKTDGIKYKKVANIAEISAKKIAEGKILGWFQGRMEYGPRSLGNRSILANPKSNKYKDRVNIEVKFREEWRPFCPSILYEESEKYLINKSEAPFMVTSFDVPKERIKEIEGVVHVDGTTRPQLVKKQVYPLYWELINEVKKVLKVPVVMNTSFNRKSEPIVCTPRDALNTFLNCGMDYLAIGNFFVQKVSLKDSIRKT